MSTKRRTFTPAEKAKIALEAIRGESTLAQISSKYNIHATQINAWKKQATKMVPGTKSGIMLRIWCQAPFYFSTKWPMIC